MPKTNAPAALAVAIPVTAQRTSGTRGFSLVEMLVAITVTTIIMGSVYGLMAQGQAAFGREPFLADRQQQARIAMDRIQEDVLSAGGNLGAFFQAFEVGLDNVGPQGVRAAADATLGGANSDFIEIRRTSPDCPPVRVQTTNGAVVRINEAAFPACYPEPGYAFLLYPDGRAKLGWIHNIITGGNPGANFPPGQQAGASQLVGSPPNDHITCSVWFGTDNNGETSPNGNACPPAPAPPAACPACPCPDCEPYALQQAEILRYQIGTDTDGTIGLFRSSTGGISAGEVATNPPGVGWQLVAIGIEDMQVEYRTTASGATWLGQPPLVADGSPNDIVLEVRVTLWTRALTPPNLRLTGETRSQGADATGVRAVRGSLVSIIAPRSAQDALASLFLWK